jgi:guanylate kinase
MIIVAIMGKSGCGKSTLEHLLSNIGYSRIISYTTRGMRDGEENHREYHFVTDEQFKNLQESGKLVESAEYAGNKYGAPKPVGSTKYVIVVETDGYKKFKELYGSQVFGVYLDLDDETVDSRIRSRGNNTNADIKVRNTEDKQKFDHVKDIADMVVDASKSQSEILAEVLNGIIDWRNKHE